jgi:probable F420-dependent oxidoreductase
MIIKEGPMDFGVSMFPTPTSAGPAEIAVAAEKAGFESYFVSEHSHIPVDTDFPIADEVPMAYKSMYDPFVSMAAAAAVTETIRLGTAILIAPQHNALNFAKAISTLDQISGGRIDVGIGAGWNAPEMENHGVAFSDRFKATRETIEAMVELWTKDEAEYNGDIVKITKSWQWPKPVQTPHPPIFIAGSGPNILKRCVALGQGWMPIFQTEWNENLRGVQTNYHELAQDVATLAELADAAGKPKIMITGMGLPPTPEHVDYLMENGVERMMLGLPHDSPEQAFETLDTYADTIKQYR